MTPQGVEAAQPTMPLARGVAHERELRRAREAGERRVEAGTGHATLGEQQAATAGRETERREQRIAEDTRRMVLGFQGRLPALAREGWVPQTVMPWLEELRAEHDAACVAVLEPVRRVPRVIVELEQERDAAGRAAHEHARERMAAALSGRQVPAAPRSFSLEAACRRVDTSWAEVDAALAEVRSVVRRVVEALHAHEDELYARYTGAEDALAITGVDPGRLVMAGWIRSTLDPMLLGEPLGFLHDLVKWGRRDLTPKWLRLRPVLPGAVW